MKYNLLKCVQLILSGMSSDEVNSIGDTVESQMVVDALETTYYHIASTVDFPDEWDFFELTASSSDTPTLMTLPTNVGKVEWIKVDWSTDTKRDVRIVKPVEREVFFDRMNTLDSAETDIYQYNITNGNGSFDVRGYNDRQPGCYTTFDDNTLIFDNFDSTIGSFLTGNRTWCYGMLVPTFTREDSFIPDFEPRQFSLFFEEAKALAFHDIKQIANPKAEQRARRGWSHAHRKEPTVPAGEIYHDFTYSFGRKRPS